MDAYQKALSAGVDLIVTATPPGFRPLIYSAAVRAGKHVFMEKPCCVDAPGYRLLLETNKLADQTGLKVGVGFQRRHSPNYLETIKRIQEGAIGRVLFLRAYYNVDGIWNRPRMPGMTEMQYQVHNWYHFCWLSGDNICEQHIHDLDVCNWVAQDHPVEANGIGGCSVRYLGKAKGTGQIFDHHAVEFTYKDGLKLFSQCRHIPGTWNMITVVAHAARGELNPSGAPAGKRASRSAGEKRGRGRSVNPSVQEHKDLIAAIRSGTKYNEGHHGATSSMTAVLGRMATYSGQLVKWDEAVEEGHERVPQNARLGRRGAGQARQRRQLPDTGSGGVQGVLNSPALARARQRRSDVLERSAGGLSQPADGCQANDDDQGEHDGILDSGRAVFGSQEAAHLVSKKRHWVPYFEPLF